MEKPNQLPEVPWMEALSMGMYGRALQNRCSVLSTEQRERLRMAAMEMVKRNNADQTPQVSDNKENNVSL
jgi:hypothetical protein